MLKSLVATTLLWLVLIADAAEPEASVNLPANSKPAVLLVTASKLADAWLPFAEWKTLNGKPTKIITVDAIAKKYKADSIHEKIRLCVREHIERLGIRWLILGGDCLPNGKGLVPGGHTTVHAQERKGIPTDIVYLSKTNWDADGDGVFGEWTDDKSAISYPDGTVGLGRIPVRTAADVKAFTDKVIAYESKYPKTGFATEMIYTCTVRTAAPKVRQSWKKYLSKVWVGGKAKRFFSDETPWDKAGKPGSYPLSAPNLLDLINRKTTGKLHIHGHGHLPAWVLERSYFTSKHVDLLANQNAYPLITTVSCNTGEYDSTKDPSIVERILRHPKGGSVAVVAPVRTGKPHFHKRSDFLLMVREGKLDGTTLTMTRYWAHGLGKRSLTTGRAMMMAKADMAADARKTPGFHLCICELNLLGDPTLDMRSKAPRTPKVNVPTGLRAGTSDLTIRTSAPGCTISVWKGSELYEVKKADKSGSATFSIQVNPGRIKIGVSGVNLNSVSSEVTVR